MLISTGVRCAGLCGVVFCLLNGPGCSSRCGEQAQHVAHPQQLNTPVVARGGAVPSASSNSADPEPRDDAGDRLLTSRDERIYRGIFSLAREETRGNLDVYIACQSGCDVQQKEEELAGLVEFHAMAPRVALSRTIEVVHGCVREGLFTLEWLYPPCEGALFSLGFFEGLPEDRVILQSFTRYVDQELSPEQTEALRNLFYSRYNGLVWYQGRPLAAEWVALVEALDRKHELFTPEQWRFVREDFLSPPETMDREQFLFPPFSIHRRLKALAK